MLILTFLLAKDFVFEKLFKYLFDNKYNVYYQYILLKLFITYFENTNPLLKKLTCF